VPLEPTAAPRGWRGLWDPRRARLWLVSCAIAAYLPALGIPFRQWLDFSAFYTAGALCCGPQLYDLGRLAAFQAAQGLPPTPFVYPAAVALAYVPLAQLPYALAGTLHMALMAAALLVAAVLGADLLGLSRRWALLGTLAWSPAAAGVLSGQNTGAALLLVVLAARAWSAGSSGWTGAAVGALAYKPQLAAPLAGLLVLRGAWRGLAALLAVVALQYLLGTAATGDPGWPRDWLAAVQHPAYTEGDLRANGWQAVSLPALLSRSAFLGPGWPSLAPLGYVLGGLVVVAAVPALRRWALLPAIALACAVGLVVSPHAWVYDGTLLLPALGIFGAASRRRGWPWQDRWLLAGAYGLAVLWPLGGFVGVVPFALVVCLAPLVLLGWGPFERFAEAGGNRPSPAGVVGA
jgi:hypothetical protein